jgi:predicted TPR repeat methyltransferase/thioredoxin-like negative regulator of GroEL
MNAIAPMAAPLAAPDLAAAAPDEADALRTSLLSRAWSMLREGRPGAAAPLLDAARRLGPASPLQAELDARCAVAEGRTEAAMDTLDMAIVALPADAGLRRCRAELHLALRDPARAAADAADAVLLDPREAPAKAVLGSALLALGRPADALACLAEAAHALPDDPRIAAARAAAEAACGQPAMAEATLREAAARAPLSADLRAALVLQLLRAGQVEAALAEAEAAHRDGVVDACLCGLRGHALSSLGRHEDAAHAYAEALRLGPDDDYVRHLAVAGGGVGDGVGAAADRAPPDYLRAVFDGYAARFETHLLALGYRVPGLIRAALLEQISLAESEAPGETATAPVLDLGCGTGMMAAVLSDLPLGPLVGVDIAPRMLEQAGAKRLYAGLHEADIPTFLAADARRWRAVLAADTLCYFGELGPLLAAIAARLTTDGVAIFSLERCAEDDAPARGWRLGRSGRYAHTDDAVRTAVAAAGLHLRALRHETLRDEGGASVSGMIVVAARAP